MVIIGHRSPLVALMQVPWIFAGQVGRLPGVTMRTGVDIEITSANPVVYHIDGEPFVGGASIKAHVRPQALRIKVPVEADLQVRQLTTQRPSTRRTSVMQGVGRAGLRHEPVAAGTGGALQLAGAVVGGQRDDRDVRGARIALETPRGLPAIDESEGSGP